MKRSADLTGQEKRIIELQDEPIEMIKSEEQDKAP